MNYFENIEKKIHRIWWVPLITGIIAMGLGIWCFCSPESSLSVFAYVFSAGLIIAGCLNLGYSVANTKIHTNWGWSLVLGILEIICGVWLFSMPAENLAIGFAWAAGIWMLVVSINAIGEAMYFSRFSTGWAIWMGILLVATVFCACYFIFNPLLGGVMGWFWIGFSLIFFGVWRISLAFKLRSFNRRIGL